MKFLITLINLSTLNKHQDSMTQEVWDLGFRHYLGQLEIRSIRLIPASGRIL